VLAIDAGLRAARPARAAVRPGDPAPPLAMGSRAT